MKKLLFLATLLVAVATSCSNDDSGADPDANLFKISSVQDLYDFKTTVETTNSAYSAKLTADIDLTGEADWVPITSYSGVLKGNGKKIKGLKITTPTGIKQGLFAQSDGAIIQDLTISCDITGEDTSTSAAAGAFVGWAENTTFKNCYTTDDSTITGAGNNTAGIAGYADNSSFESCTNRAAVNGVRYTAGIVGYTCNEITISSSTNEGSITSTLSTSNNYTAGIVARIYTSGTVTNCTNLGVVSSTTKYVGGVVGYATSALVENCVNNGDVDGGINTGGVTGANNSTTTIINCYNTASVTSTSSWVGGVTSDVNSESVVVNCYNLGAVSKDDCGIAYRNQGYVYNCYSSQDGAIYSNSDGTAEYAYYDNGTDTDGTESDGITGLSSTTMTSSTFAETLSANAQAYNYSDPAPSYLACNWKSVSSSYPALNVGNTTVRSAKTWSISNEAQLKEILGAIGDGTYYSYDTYKLTANITLTEEWTPVAEVFSGTFNGNSKKILGLTISSATSSLQGLFAQCSGATFKNLTVEANITNTESSYEKMAAIVGDATNSTFTSCATTSTSTITSSGNNTAGLVGWAVGSTFTSCKNYATVNGAAYTGGIVGTISTSSPSTITSCSNYGAVSDSQSSSSVGHMGGIAGYFGGVSTASKCVNEGDITSYTTGDVGGVIGFVYSGSTVINCSNSGTINCSATTVNGTDVGGVVGYSYGDISNVTNSGAVSNGSDTVGGVLGCNDGGTLSNATNSGAVAGAAGYIGGVIGYNKWGTLTSLTNKSTGVVTAYGSFSGGVAGRSDAGSITYATNSAAVTGAQYTGGVVGYNTATTVSRSSNSGDVKGTYNIGGITGNNYNSAVIMNCYNTGAVSSDTYTTYAGGIAGDNNTATIINCYNLGSVHIDSGITYRNYSSATTSNCYSSVNGIYSNTNGGTFDCCYYDSGETAVDEAGGIIGLTTTYMKSSDFVTKLNEYVESYNVENSATLASWKKVSGGYPTFE